MHLSRWCHCVNTPVNGLDLETAETSAFAEVFMLADD